MAFHTSIVTAFLFLAIGISVASVEKPEKLEKNNTISYKKSLYKECENSYSITCLKLDIVSWVDKLDENPRVDLLPGVSVVKDNVSDSASSEQMVAELGRKFPNDSDARLNAYLMKKVTGYLDNHSVKLNLWNTAAGEARGKGGGGGGGGGKKGGGGLEYILAAGAMMKATLYALALWGIGAVAAKALMTALISLVISAVIGLKSLTHHGGHTSYEVISKPVVLHSNTQSESHDYAGHYEHGAYRRSLGKAALPLGLRPDYKPTP